MKCEIEINGINYKLLKNKDDAFDLEIIKLKLTSFFEEYDFIVGDWAYGKLRLKGFNRKSNKNYCLINDYNKIDDYIDNYCAYGCKYFVLEKLEIEK